MAAAASRLATTAAGDPLHPAFNKVAIVTGAGGTLGEAFVRALLVRLHLGVDCCLLTMKRALPQGPPAQPLDNMEPC